MVAIFLFLRGAVKKSMVYAEDSYTFTYYWFSLTKNEKCAILLILDRVY